MTIALAVSFAVSTCTGLLLLWLGWPRTAAWSWPLATALGAGLGSGLSAVLLFLWMLPFGPTGGFPWAEGGLLVLVALAAVRRRLAGHTGAAQVTLSQAGAAWEVLVVVIAFLVTLGAAGAAFISHLRRHPHGEWDAWMNWDLRARMFFRGGEAWQTGFSAALPWSHPDYPVLLPSLVTRTWLYAGGETLAGPALVAGTFTFATVALVAAGLAALRSTSQGLLAGLVLLSTPFFILHGTSLYADVPLGFFFLATIVCLALQERSGSGTNRFAVLAGIAAGLAMWTKNEGVLFTLAVMAGLLIAGWSGGWATSRRQLLAFGAGLIPMLLLLAGFKMGLAPENDLLSTLDFERTFSRLTDPHRYFLVFRAYGSYIASFGDNGLGSATAVLTAYLLALGINRAELRRSWVRAVTIALVLLLAGHFMVFVSMADELSRLLKSSLDRLLLQIWPSALFLYFMVVRTHEEVRSGRPVTGPAEVGQGARV